MRSGGATGAGAAGDNRARGADGFRIDVRKRLYVISPSYLLNYPLYFGNTRKFTAGQRENETREKNTIKSTSKLLSIKIPTYLAFVFFSNIGKRITCAV